MIDTDKALRDALAAASMAVRMRSSPDEAGPAAVAAFLGALPPGGIWFASGSIVQPQMLARHLRELARVSPCTACNGTGWESYATGQHEERQRACGHCPTGAAIARQTP